MVATTYSFVDTIERSGMCNVRSEEHFNISDGGIEAARDAPCYILPEHSHGRPSPDWALFKFGTIECPRRRNVPRAEQFRIEMSVFFFSSPTIMSEERRRETERDRVLLAVC